MSQGPRLADLKVSTGESVTTEIARLESASTANAPSDSAVELDARQLAKDCLKELAGEMGIAR